MECLTMILMNSSEAISKGYDQLFIRLLQPIEDQAYVTVSMQEGHMLIKVEEQYAQQWGPKESSALIEAIGYAITRFIVQEKEEELLKEMLRKDFKYENEQEVNEIIRYYYHQLSLEDEAATSYRELGRERMLSREARTMLKESGQVNITGLLHFRLQDYRDELHERMEFAIDEHLIEKQYQEFISLLRYFVYIQQSQIPFAHLMHHGGHEFGLLNEQMLPIDTEHLDTSISVEVLDQDFRFEDLIVSTLITIAPQKICIHTREPHLQVIQTIKQIFEDRAVICTYCQQCGPHLGEPTHQDQLST